MDYGLKARGYLSEAAWLLLETTQEIEKKKRTELTDKQRSILKIIRGKVFTARCFIDLARKRPIPVSKFWKSKSRIQRHVRKRKRKG